MRGGETSSLEVGGGVAGGLELGPTEASVLKIRYTEASTLEVSGTETSVFELCGGGWDGHRDGDGLVGAIGAVGRCDGEGVGGVGRGSLPLSLGGRIGERPGNGIDADGAAASGSNSSAEGQHASGGISERGRAGDRASGDGGAAHGGRSGDWSTSPHRDGDGLVSAIGAVGRCDGEGVGGVGRGSLPLSLGGRIGERPGNGIDADGAAASGSNSGAEGQRPSLRIRERCRPRDYTGGIVRATRGGHTGHWSSRQHCLHSQKSSIG